MATLLRRLLHRPPQPRPDGGPVTQEVLSGDRIGGQKCPRRKRSLGGITGLAGGDQVTIGAVAAPHLRLHVVDREFLLREDLRTIHAAKTVATEDPLPCAQIVTSSPGIGHRRDGWPNLDLNPGAIIALSGIRPLIAVTVVSWLLSGVVSWLMGGAGTVHIGASGIVFGYVFFVIVRGLFTRRILHIVVGLIVGFYYGLEALAGLSPMLDGVSWQGHLGGAIGGVATAYGSRKDRRPRKVTAGSTGWTTGPRR